MAEYLEVAFRGGLSVSYPHSETILSFFLHITLNDVGIDALAKVYESMNLEVRESRKQLELHHQLLIQFSSILQRSLS